MYVDRNHHFSLQNQFAKITREQKVLFIGIYRNWETAGLWDSERCIFNRNILVNRWFSLENCESIQIKKILPFFVSQWNLSLNRMWTHGTYFKVFFFVNRIKHRKLIRSSFVSKMLFSNLYEKLSQYKCCLTKQKKNYEFLINILTPSSLPCNKCTAPARWIPGKNHTGCVNNKRSYKPKSHGGFVESDAVPLVDVSPSAKIPPSELDTGDARD